MTDDLKQKADEAWENVGRNDIRAAVSASIAAALAEALAPVLERVARLEYRSTATATGVLPNGERVQCTECSGTTNSPSQFAWTCLDGRWRCETHSKPAAPCATCGGARWVCDVSVDGASYHRKPCPDCSKPAASPEGTLQHNPGLGSVTMSTEQAAALLKSSKPAAGPEGETACTRHGQYRCPACAAGMVEEAQPPSPAESKGSGPRGESRGAGEASGDVSDVSRLLS